MKAAANKSAQIVRIVRIEDLTNHAEAERTGATLDDLERRMNAVRVFRVHTSDAKKAVYRVEPGVMHPSMIRGTHGPYPSPKWAKRYSPRGPFRVPLGIPDKDVDKVLELIERETRQAEARARR